jgi:carbon-monoxide dehydrogenase large subunit
MKTANAYIGSPIKRIEDLRFLRGQGQFVDDVSMAGVLHAFILRSSVAHGRLNSIDDSAALAMPGVHAVLTAEQVGSPVPIIPLRQLNLPLHDNYRQPVIAVNKVRYVGEPIAVVIADTPALAEDAASAIKTEIEALPVAANGSQALRDETLLFEDSSTNFAGQFTATVGNVDNAFASAAYTRRESFSVHRHTALPMEMRGLIAQWNDSDRRLKVWGATKVVFFNRRTLAGLLGLESSQVELVENDVGGGFGARGEFYPEDFLIPFAARYLGRPVKWVEDRRDHLLTINHARESTCDLEIACQRDGRILALRGSVQADMGAYIRTNGPTAAFNCAQILIGPYRIENYRMDVSMAMTNKTPVGTYRGPGRFESDFFRERMFDIAAGELSIDRVEFRRRNLIRPADMPHALPDVAEQLNWRGECDSGNYENTLDLCLRQIKWNERCRRQGKMPDGRYYGLGIGCYIEGGGAGPRENAKLTLDADGTVAVYVGSSALGQGIETVLAQIAADALEMPLERIRGVYHGSTAYVEEGFGSFGSRATVMGGSAILAAATTLRRSICSAAANRLNVDIDDVKIVDGVEVKGRDGSSLLIGELAGDIDAAVGTFASSKRTYSYGAHAAHIAVDPRTGRVELLDYVAVEDVGRVVNPHTLHGQTLGALVQGLGGTLLEDLVYDSEGQLLTGSLADYLVPTASDFPNLRVHSIGEHPSPHNPLGVKGAGEGGIIPVAGVISNAVAAALASMSVQPRHLPLSPPRVWQLITDACAEGNDQSLSGPV